MDRESLSKIIDVRVSLQYSRDYIMKAVDEYVSQFRLNAQKDERPVNATPTIKSPTIVQYEPESRSRIVRYEVLRTNVWNNADLALPREDWVRVSVGPNAKAAHEAQARCTKDNAPNHYAVEEVEIYRAILEPPAPTEWNMTVFPLDDSIPHRVHEVTLAQLEDPQYNGYWKISAEAVKNSRRIIIEPKE